jgi:hypothetical protein
MADMSRQTILLVQPNEFEIGDDIEHTFVLRNNILFINNKEITLLDPKHMDKSSNQYGIYLLYKEELSEQIARILSSVHTIIDFHVPEYLLSLIDALIIRLYDRTKLLYETYRVQDGELSSPESTNLTCVFMDDDEDDLDKVNFNRVIDSIH